MFDFKGITSEKELRTLMMKMIAAFYVLGLILELSVFPRPINHLTIWLTVVCELMLPVFYLMFRRGWIDDNRALTLQAISVSITLFNDMVVWTVIPKPGSDIIIVICVALMMVPVIAAGATTVRSLPFILSGITMLLYCVGTYLLSSSALTMFISMTFLLFGTALFQRIIMNAWRRTEQTKQRIAEQNAVISRFFNITTKEFEQITKGKMTRQSAAELLERSEKTFSTALIDRAKEETVHQTRPKRKRQPAGLY